MHGDHESVSEVAPDAATHPGKCGKLRMGYVCLHIRRVNWRLKLQRDKPREAWIVSKFSRTISHPCSIPISLDDLSHIRCAPSGAVLPHAESNHRSPLEVASDTYLA